VRDPGVWVAQISRKISTWRWWGFQPYAPAAFTPTGSIRTETYSCAMRRLGNNFGKSQISNLIKSVQREPSCSIRTKRQTADRQTWRSYWTLFAILWTRLKTKIFFKIMNIVVLTLSISIIPLTLYYDFHHKSDMDWCGTDSVWKFFCLYFRDGLWQRLSVIKDSTRFSE